MEDRICVVARSTAEFMRFGTREAALYSLALMEIEELNQLLMALVITCIRVKLQQRRARLAGSDTTSLFRRLGLLIRMIGLVFHTISSMMFTDGTFRATCRPAQRPEDFDQDLSTQRPFYSGHKRRHGFKFQGTMLPNGMFASLHGSFVGRRHDGHLFRLFPQHDFYCSY